MGGYTNAGGGRSLSYLVYEVLKLLNELYLLQLEIKMLNRCWIRNSVLVNSPSLLQKFGMHILPLLIQNTNISSFLAGVFNRKDQHVLLVALHIVEMILQKLSDIFLSSFIKEGALFAIDALSLK
ncbi:hypothetical protein F2P56_022226 [Juglans regia]|uniref:Uncharacterized protein n=1 Tax=Juglans regia TaxID=51240 RepID=A0A833UJY4_JUGRE|nr:hypothetical protein F2P56_022226 [Juglans regia]